MREHEDTQEFAAIRTDDAPKAIGPYSQAIRASAGSMLFVSGQIALLPQTGQLIRGDVEAQTHQVMRNLSAVLKAAGAGLEQLVKVTIYLKNLEDFGVVNAVYASYLTSPYPARGTVEVSRLPMDALVEIEGVAVL